MNTTWLIGNALQTPRTLLALLRNVKKQADFIQEILGDELAAAKNANDGSLDATDFKKITQYYGLAVPAILGEAICALRGSPMTLRERMALTYQGAITGFFDDFFDKQGFSNEQVKAFMESPQELAAHSTSGKLFLGFWKKVLEYAHDSSLMLSYLPKIYEAQIESKKQAGPGLTKDEILKITLHKGAVSVLFYRSVLAHPFRSGEEEALYKMGGLMQFGNDVFDVFNDRNDNIHTLLTTTKKIDDVRAIFRSVMENSFAAAYHAGYPSKNVKKFLRIVSMSLCSRCFVCFDQLEKKEALSNNIFSPGQYSREDLVCDMDKGGNKWRSVLYHIKHRIKIPPQQKVS